MIEYKIKIPVPTVLKKNSKAIYSLNVHLGTHYRTYSVIKNKHKLMYLKELEKHDKVCLVSVSMHYELWLRNNRSIDMDNIVFTKKFLQDTMVEHGYIAEDNCKILTKNTEVFGGVDTDTDLTYVIVTIRGQE